MPLVTHTGVGIFSSPHQIRTAIKLEMWDYLNTPPQYSYAIITFSFAVGMFLVSGYDYKTFSAGKLQTVGQPLDKEVVRLSAISLQLSVRYMKCPIAVLD